MLKIDFGPGVLPDITYSFNQWWIVIGNTVKALDSKNLTILDEQILPNAYGRSDSRICKEWVVYRALTNDLSTLFNLRTNEIWQSGVALGNSPVAVNKEYWAYQSFPDCRIQRALLSNPLQFSPLGIGAPTGLSRIKDDGSIIKIDDDRGIIVGGTIPAFADDLSVCENPDGGILCRLSNGKELRIWPGEITKNPRCASDGEGNYCVTAWSDGSGVQGIRIALISKNEFTDPIAVHTDPSLTIDMIPFFVGGSWPHTSKIGDPNSTLDLQVNLSDRPHTFTFLKWENRLCQEVLRYDDNYIYHHEDHTDELSNGGKKAWCLTDGRWIPRITRVGDIIDANSNEIKRIDESGNVISVSPFPYKNTTIAHYSSYPCGGDVGTREVVVLKYDPTWSNPHNEGNYELFFFAKGWGWFRWEAHDFHGDTLVMSADMVYLGGTRVSPAPLLVPLPGTIVPNTNIPLPSGVNILYPVPGKDIPIISLTGIRSIMKIRIPPCPVDHDVIIELVNGSLESEIDTIDGKRLGRSSLPRLVKIV
jgi:hypothetical protein